MEFPNVSLNVVGSVFLGVGVLTGSVCLARKCFRSEEEKKIPAFGSVTYAVPDDPAYTEEELAKIEALKQKELKDLEALKWIMNDGDDQGKGPKPLTGRVQPGLPPRRKSAASAPQRTAPSDPWSNLRGGVFKLRASPASLKPAAPLYPRLPPKSSSPVPVQPRAASVYPQLNRAPILPQPSAPSLRQQSAPSAPAFASYNAGLSDADALAVAIALSKPI